MLSVQSEQAPLSKQYILIPACLPHHGKNARGIVQIRQGRERAGRAAKRGNIQRLAKPTVLRTLATFVVGVQDQALDMGGVMDEYVMNRLGALDDEGAFSVSSPLLSEEFSNARRLRAGQQGGK